MTVSKVQSSNMGKLDSNGKPIYNDNGKVMKGPNYFKPNLTKFYNHERNFILVSSGIAWA